MKNIYEILEENGMALEEGKKAEFEKQLFASYKSVAEVEKKDSKISSLQQEVEALRASLQEQADAQALQEKVTQLEEALSQAKETYAQALEERDFSNALDRAIEKAKGRNPKAILALLDTESLKSGEDREKTIASALEALQKSDAYLFGDRELPPLYARGTGAATGAQKKMPATLAGALKERFDKERK